jgi:hypothetical protein
MQIKVAEKFGRKRIMLQNALKCEDYDDEGLLDLEQVREAIVEAVDDEVDD